MDTALPYIILVVDEFADLIMTAGKEVEVCSFSSISQSDRNPFNYCNQRPSVNVITGLIKPTSQNCLRVTSKIDSRTILDTSGADQLIGRGDMLYTNGNDVVRIQCAFIDTLR
jgi:S-DNA-T family DNA segregation ATPase FtsK/SpoIIIE